MLSLPCLLRLYRPNGPGRSHLFGRNAVWDTDQVAYDYFFSLSTSATHDVNLKICIIGKYLHMKPLATAGTCERECIATLPDLVTKARKPKSLVSDSRYLTVIR